MKKGPLKACLAICNFWWMLAFSSQVMPSENHLLDAEEQLKNRCSEVSSTPFWQRTQLYPDCRNFFFLLRIFLVFSLSFRSSQANSFIFGTHFVFQIQRIVR
jgi:hypothetical protein